jgi:hypothetical protein
MFIVVLMHACNLLVQSAAGITHDTTTGGLFFVPHPLGFVRGSGTGNVFR